METNFESIEARVDYLKKIFTQLKDWEDKYKWIIQKGKNLEESSTLSEAEKEDKLRVSGCQSQVWLKSFYDEKSNILSFKANSDALIAKGLVGVVVSIYQHQEPAKILKHSPDFLIDLGLSENLSPSRSNGLYSMLKQLKLYAQVYELMNLKQ